MNRLLGRWADVRRLLVVRLDSIGDVLMTTPALRALVRAAPGVELTLLTSPAGAAVARLLPEVTETLVHEASWMKGASVGPDGRPAAADPADDLGLIARLARGAFDGAVIFTVHSQSALPAALVCHLAGIPLRLAHVRENPYRLLTDHVPDPESFAPSRHEVRRQLDLVATIGASIEDEHLSIRVPPIAARRVRAIVDELGLRLDRPWAAVHPGASASSRRYPADGFATAARVLAHDHDWDIVVLGSGADGPVADAVVAGLGGRAISLVDRLDLGEVAALLALAPVLIANNSGPAHIAAAVGTPVVDLYALTNLQHAPWGVPSRLLAHDVPCKGCRKSICPEGHHACLREVDPGEIVVAALELVEPRPAEVAPPAGILAALGGGRR
jgi:lipopolysaccharide heptosyltransferase II